jgi:Bacteriophage Lambda NinG protein.
MEIKELKFTDELYKKVIPRNPFKIKRRRVDILFSIIVRYKQNYICARCGTQSPPPHKGLHVSHYFSRTREATRFDYDNVDCLCHGCHMLWSKNYRSEYIAFKKKQLGKEKYNALAARAKIKNVFADGWFKKDELARTHEFKRIIAQNKITVPIYH